MLSLRVDLCFSRDVTFSGMDDEAGKDQFTNKDTSS